MLSEAIHNIYPEMAYVISENVVTWSDSNIDMDLINAEIEKLEVELPKKAAVVVLNELCDTKTAEAKLYISGMDISTEQLERYKEKYKMSLAYKEDGSYESNLTLEANVTGMTVDELADLIITKGVAYDEAMMTFNSRIEAFRVAVSNLIENNELEKVYSILESARAFDANTTDEDVAALFEE